MLSRRRGRARSRTRRSTAGGLSDHGPPESPVIPREPRDRGISVDRGPSASLGREHAALRAMSASCSHFPRSGLHRSSPRDSTIPAPPAPGPVRDLSELGSRTAPKLRQVSPAPVIPREPRDRGISVDRARALPHPSPVPRSPLSLRARGGEAPEQRCFLLRTRSERELFPTVGVRSFR
jgi:hypothetical protein